MRGGTEIHFASVTIRSLWLPACLSSDACVLPLLARRLHHSSAEAACCLSSESQSLRVTRVTTRGRHLVIYTSGDEIEAVIHSLTLSPSVSARYLPLLLSILKRLRTSLLTYSRLMMHAAHCVTCALDVTSAASPAREETLTGRRPFPPVLRRRRAPAATQCVR